MTKHEQPTVADAMGGRRVSRRAPISQRLTQRTAAPYQMPEPVLASLALFQGSVNDFKEHLTRLEQSPILWSGIVQIPSTGVFTRSWQVQYQCVSISNLTGAVITIAPGDATGTAPTTGAGVHQLPAGSAGRYGTISDAIAIYGTPGTYIDFAVATRWVDGL